MAQEFRTNHLCKLKVLGDLRIQRRKYRSLRQKCIYGQHRMHPLITKGRICAMYIHARCRRPPCSFLRFFWKSLISNTSEEKRSKRHFHKIEPNGRFCANNSLSAIHRMTSAKVTKKIRISKLLRDYFSCGNGLVASECHWLVRKK